MATQDSFTGKEAVERLNQLPPEVRELIYSADMTRIIQEIGKSHHLHVDQVGRLEAETSFLMLGFTDQKDFPEVLAARLGVNEDTAGVIATDVHDRLLIKIRESLKNLYPGTTDAVSGQGPAQQASKPAIHNVLPKIAVAPQQPVVAPKTKQTPELASITDTLTAPQVAPKKTVDVGNLPGKLRSGNYSSDPYLEPIE